jgi:hypothetical protein
MNIYANRQGVTGVIESEDASIFRDIKHRERLRFYIPMTTLLLFQIFIRLRKQISFVF